MKLNQIVFKHLTEKENKSAYILLDLYVRYYKILKKNVNFPQKNKWFLILGNNFNRLKLNLLADDCLSQVDPTYYREEFFIELKTSFEHLDKSLKALEKKDLSAARYHSDNYDFFLNSLTIIPWLENHSIIGKIKEFISFKQILVNHPIFKDEMMEKMYY